MRKVPEEKQEKRRAAEYLLLHGILLQYEIGAALGHSRQGIRAWARAAGIKPGPSRERFIERQIQAALKRARRDIRRERNGLQADEKGD
jgi:hypothetical protein